MSAYRLYYSPGACSFAVHIALEEAGCDYDAHRVVIANKENRAPAYLAVNPRGRVPALWIADERGERVLTEAMAIMVYLARRFPDRQLLPLDGEDFERALEWMGWLASTVHQTGTRAVIRPGAFVDDEACQAQIATVGRARVRGHYQDIEQRLTGREWALGERFSLVDAYLLVFFRWGNKVGMDVRGDFPHYSAIMDRARQRPAVQRVIEREGIDLDKGS